MGQACGCGYTPGTDPKINDHQINTLDDQQNFSLEPKNAQKPKEYLFNEATCNTDYMTTNRDPVSYRSSLLQNNLKGSSIEEQERSDLTRDNQEYNKSHRNSSIEHEVPIVDEV